MTEDLRQPFLASALFKTGEYIKTLHVHTHMYPTHGTHNRWMRGTCTCVQSVFVALLLPPNLSICLHTVYTYFGSISA